MNALAQNVTKLSKDYEALKKKCRQQQAEIEALKKQQASIHNPLFINQQQGEVKQGFYEVLRKAQEK